ncbi:hypothetical protein [Dactylosporangium sp. CS-033363]|uniref:hypothetical protein n=1 Tax=Dactylosporangium sp. CS-033363 TaxID=3239935 RepID=UPI003D8C4283
MTLIDDLRFRSDIDGDLHLVLPAGRPGSGWTVTVVMADGGRSEADPEGPGTFSYYGRHARWWWVERRGAAHVEVVAPDGTTAVLHHERLFWPAKTCPVCGVGIVRA